MITLPEINILPKEIYQLIAAGEVVERPSSVVKEMIENSIDAGSKSVTVEIKNGGSTYIRITDDGCGIAKSQVKKVFIPHATSKITVRDDLDAIATLGFRGEAMASISAVAKVELITRSKDEELGTRYEIAGSQEIDFSDAGCPVGTTIVVRDIFYNTPARMKFLKKDVTEGNAVSAVVESMAVSHADISFRFIRDGKQILMTSGNGNLKDAVYSVFGKEFASSLIEVDYSINHMRISGLVTKPHASRKSRSMQYFFINSRMVKSKTALAALEQAYKNLIMVGRFPGCVLNIECDTSFVDVNVHPAKIEVRFANEKPVFDLVYYGVKSAIEMGDTPKEAVFKEQPSVSGKLDFLKKEEPPVQMKFSQRQYANDFSSVAAPKKYNADADKASAENKNQYSGFIRISSNNTEEKQQEVEAYREVLNSIAHSSDNNPVGIVSDSEDKVKNNPPVQEIEIPDFTVVGEAFRTYIIVQIDNDLFVIDKHAAHERMNFEKLKSETVINSQVLLVPVVVKLSSEEYTLVCDNIELYKKCGFSVEDFGNSSVIVRECPSILDGEDVEDLILETAQKLIDGKTDIMPEQMDWIFHSTSCRAAVKAGDYTSPYERDLFVKKLLSMPEIRYCPHGRPVMIKISKYDIEKQFGRV